MGNLISTPQPVPPLNVNLLRASPSSSPTYPLFLSLLFLSRLIRAMVRTAFLPSLCPITHQTMEHPFVTSSGRSYEYSAISSWLAVHDTDPMTNERLASKTLIPNHSLRSQIVAWFEENPSSAGLRNNDAASPPPGAYQVGINGLDKILVYRDKRETKGKNTSEAEAGAKAKTLPSTFTAYGHTYSFTRRERRLRITCDGQVTIDMPERCVFAVPDGLIFYHPKETLDKLILPGTEVVSGCHFQGSCNQGNCKFAHPFA